MRSRHREVAVALFFGAITWLASPIFAQTTWTDATGAWENATNWDNGVPNSTTDARINNGGTAQINASDSALNVVLGLNAGNSGSLSLPFIGDSLAASGDITVGDGGTGTMGISLAGLATSVNGVIGNAAGSTGVVTVDGGLAIFSSRWTMSGSLTVGNAGTGTLSITNGGVVSNTDGAIGNNAHSTGTATVDGVGSKWMNTGDLFVGASDTGTLHIQNGGAVSNTIGYIGYNAGSSGAVTVASVVASWTNSGALYVGYGGTGTLDIQSGAKVSNTDGDIGFSARSNGRVTVDNDLSTWTNSGTLTVGDAGTGTLNVTNGAGVSDVNGIIGNATGSKGTVNVDGQSFIGVSKWTNSGSLDVGLDGHGTLNITHGGTVAVNGSFARIAEHANSTGTVTVDGTGSTWTLANELDVARAGTGTLTIQNKGIVNVTGPGRASIGVLAKSNGTASVDGSGSMWTNSAGLIVGETGTGTLHLTNGGVVSNTFGELGLNTNSNGTATVDGVGSTWTNNGTLTVGGAGTGSLAVTNGGTISSNMALIGANPTGNGTAIVNGAGSTWTATSLYVGGDPIGAKGTGLLRILNGGTVNAATTTVWSTGILEVGVNPVLNSALTFDGGTLRTIANTTFSNAILLGAGGIIVDSNGFTSTLSGSINGVVGGLTKINNGTVILTNANTYAGDTNINGGVLQVDGSITSNIFVNSGGTLAGTGTIFGIFGHVTNSGIVSPGDSPGTLTINGNYSQNSIGTLRIEVAGLPAGQHDLLSVGGSATLNGTLQVLALNNFQPMNGDRVTIINDAGGHSGTFSAVTGTFTGVFQPVPMYNEANDVYILFQLGSFNIGGLTPNQKSVAHNLDNAVNDPAAANLIAFLELEPRGSLPHDYDLIAPEELASIYEIGFSQAVVQNNNLQRRMDDIRAGSNGFCANGFTPQVSGKDYTKESDGKVSLPDKNTHDVYTPAADNRWGVFVTGTGDFVNVGNNDFNAHGYDITTGDFTVGADYRLCDHFAIGIDAGYSRSNADLVDDGRVEVDGGKIGAYATVFGKGLFGSKFYIDGGVGGGLNSYDTRRTGLQGEPVRGDTDGSEFNAFIAYGSDWTFGCFNIGTWSTVQYTNVSIDEFTETGSLAPLEIQDQDENSFRATTGVHASYDIKTGHFIFRPEVRVAYQHEYCDSAYQIDSRLASGAGDVFRVRGPRIGRDAALVGAGMSMQWNNRLSTYVYYDGVLGRNNYDNNAVSGGFRIGF